MSSNQWIPIKNRKRLFNGHTRHYFQTCPLCRKKKKNIVLHYKTYHPDFFKRHFIDPFFNKEIGELHGVRFITSTKDPI